MSNEPTFPKNNVPKESDSHRNLNPTILLGVILLLGMLLRIYDLGTESYWIDEMSTVVEGQLNIFQVITSGRLDQPPAYYLPFHYWVQMFGSSEVMTRLFSTLLGAGSIVLIYLIGKDLFGSEVGLLAAFLMTISEFQIYYSQQARFYSFFQFAALVSFFLFIRALSGKRKIDFALYAGASVLMVYSHAYGLFILASQGLFLILQWKKFRDVIVTWLVCQVIVVLAVIPYFYPLIFGGLGGALGKNIGGLSLPLLRDPIRSVYRFIMSARGERSWDTMLINYGVATALLVVGMGIYTVRIGWHNLLDSIGNWFANLQDLPDAKSRFLLISCWLICPILLPFIFSFVIGPMYLDRYTISAAPAFYLLLGLGLFSIRKIVPVILSLAVLVVMIAPSLEYYYETDVHEQWREVAAYVAENSQPNDAIVIAPNSGIGIQQKTFNWYYQGPLQECSLGAELLDPTMISDSLMSCVSTHDRFWVVIRDNESASSRRYTSFFLDPDQTDMHLIDEHDFVQISLYLFEVLK